MRDSNPVCVNLGMFIVEYLGNLASVAEGVRFFAAPVAVKGLRTFGQGVGDRERGNSRGSKLALTSHMDWTLEVTRKGERQSTEIGKFRSESDAVDQAERRSPRGIHWTNVMNGRMGVAGDCQYLVRNNTIQPV
ncbi:MAG: hypothetical protein H0U59_00815 [Gemmatimonadaceae bacterium]|nr:hypothetical protein [Gemmatimonadaceae bacterium]